ncbi:hypothetical protein [Nocardia bovistercoris]|uniref:WXG100 family type VII secretion target n=1 Tax=Nocardia bovistercoris TaxID=2785916 RepID=A0A931IFD0_9NOCA|nr:hypothetical protein [Nocardia bovistercoris]MBH0779431.1 hypothetical protein [Nocardia bovistercoris]
MTDLVSVESLRTAIDNLETKIDEWKQVPDKLNDTVDGLRNAGIFNAGALAAYQFATGYRDKAQDLLQDLFELFQQIIDGIAAPFSFIDYAADWQSVGASIRKAYGEQDDQSVSIEGYWKGAAKNKFAAARANQMKAMTGMESLTDKVHTNLLDLAKSGLDLYITVFDKITGLLAKLVTAVEQTGSIVFTYMGAPELVAVLNDTIKTVADLISAMVKSVASQMIAANEFDNLSDNPWGVPHNRWPQSEADSYDGVTDRGDEAWEVAR